MKSLLFVVALAALCACSNTEELASCKGPTFALNTGHWAPSLADLEMSKHGQAE